MKYISFTYIISFLTILSSGCNKQKESDSLEKGTPFTIDFEQCMATEQAMKISEIADTVEYLELKTPEDIVITRIWDIFPIDDFLIIHSRDGVFKFTQKGDFIKKIGRSGQGPGEYSLISCIDVDLIKKEIVLKDVEQILFYDLEGNYLRNEKWGYLFRIGLSDSIIWVSELVKHTDKYIAFALDHLGDTIASIPNPRYGMKSQDDGLWSSIAQLLKPYYHYKGFLQLKGTTVNDTIYQLSGINRIPYAFLNMGKYKLPIEYEFWNSWAEFNKHGSRYWGIPSVAEDDNYFYLFAQRFRSIDGNNYSEIEDNYRYILYDKEKRKGFVIRDEKVAKITDDILGGPPIWPYWVTDDYYMNVVEWYELSEEIKKGNYTLASSLEKQFADLGNDTNQLIVLCRRKK